MSAVGILEVSRGYVRATETAEVGVPLSPSASCGASRSPTASRNRGPRTQTALPSTPAYRKKRVSTRAPIHSPNPNQRYVFYIRMFSRVSHIARHFSRSLPNYAHTSAAAGGMSGTRMIRTAACLIIGDEVLGGKTNSAFLAKWCFSHGVDLKRIETIPDDAETIIESARRLSAAYDFVVTSGGIGPTHDDITYSSLATAFNVPLVLHEGAYARMRRLAKPHKSQPNFDWNVDSEARRAKERMVLLPLAGDGGEGKEYKDQVLFPAEELWVPVVCVGGNVHVLPGVPRLFERLIQGLGELLEDRLGEEISRVIVSTPMSESAVAPYLEKLQAEVEEKGVKVGSYPRWGKNRNTVTLVGKDKAFLESLVADVEKNVEGRRVFKEGEDDVEGAPAQGSQ
ncbi:hypothetical protein V492_01755 [Pseudogymnoascus sp. VKM F-4246]|nr:hypothetical protein V492_01755 [Pseudogymnoascus sp. VKM F-4246]